MARIAIRAFVLVLLASCQLGTFPPVVTGPPICNAQHSWENYHLPHWALQQPVIVHNTSSYVPNLQAWNALEGNPITLTVDSGNGFVIEIRDGGDADSDYLGLAAVWANSAGHISKGVVTMNLTLLARYDDNVAAHVLAQEIGHILGLDHQRGADDSAMNDCAGLSSSAWIACLNSEAGMTPNAHDGEQLAKIYSHVKDETQPPCSGIFTVHTFMDYEGEHGH